MGFIQKILRQIEYAEYTPVENYGEIYSERVVREEFTLAVQLLRSEADWALRLDLNRRWGGTGNRTLTDCHFHKLGQIGLPIQGLLADVKAGVTFPNVDLHLGPFAKWVMNASAGQPVRAYGRIDHHPRDEDRFRLALFLTWDGERHWVVLKLGEGSPEWTKWPVGMAGALYRLFPRIDQTIEASAGTHEE